MGGRGGSSGSGSSGGGSAGNSTGNSGGMKTAANGVQYEADHVGAYGEPLVSWAKTAGYKNAAAEVDKINSSTPSGIIALPRVGTAQVSIIKYNDKQAAVMIKDYGVYNQTSTLSLSSAKKVAKGYLEFGGNYNL